MCALSCELWLKFSSYFPVSWFTIDYVCCPSFNRIICHSLSYALTGMLTRKYYFQRYIYINTFSRSPVFVNNWVIIVVGACNLLFLCLGGFRALNDYDYKYSSEKWFSKMVPCKDWLRTCTCLLQGIEMYGLGNWNEVAEHVGTKSRSQCIDHYNTIYMNSLCFPLPVQTCIFSVILLD